VLSFLTIKELALLDITLLNFVDYRIALRSAYTTLYDSLIPLGVKPTGSFMKFYHLCEDLFVLSRDDIPVILKWYARTGIEAWNFCAHYAHFVGKPVVEILGWYAYDPRLFLNSFKNKLTVLRDDLLWEYKILLSHYLYRPHFARRGGCSEARSCFSSRRPRDYRLLSYMPDIINFEYLWRIRCTPQDVLSFELFPELSRAPVGSSFCLHPHIFRRGSLSFHYRVVFNVTTHEQSKYLYGGITNHPSWDYMTPKMKAHLIKFR
jgi:hypothetical protein